MLATRWPPSRTPPLGCCWRHIDSEEQRTWSHASPRAQAGEAAWDLEPLVDGAGEQGVRERLEEAIARPTSSRSATPARSASSTRRAGRGDALARGDPRAASRAGYYAALRFSTDTADPARGALLQQVQEQETRVATALLFFELEWAALDADRAELLLADHGLEFCAPLPARRAPLSRAPAQRGRGADHGREDVTGAGAWSRLFEELTSAIEVQMPAGAGVGESVALDVAL